MGCDWYEIYVYMVLLKDQKSKMIEYSRRPCYTLHYDSDNEDCCQAIDREIETFCKQPKKVLYSDGEWTIQSEAKISEIKDIISYEKIAFDDVASISRMFLAEERY